MEDGTDPIEEERGERARMLLSGTCRLEFEGQRFVPDGEPGRQCWLEVSEAARAPLSQKLGRNWRPEFDEFHAEFWGVMYWTPRVCGHFRMSESFARMDELVSARIRPHPARPPSRKKCKNLTDVLTAGRASTR